MFDQVILLISELLFVLWFIRLTLYIWLVKSLKIHLNWDWWVWTWTRSTSVTICNKFPEAHDWSLVFTDCAQIKIRNTINNIDRFQLLWYKILFLLYRTCKFIKHTSLIRKNKDFVKRNCVTLYQTNLY